MASSHTHRSPPAMAPAPRCLLLTALALAAGASQATELVGDAQARVPSLIDSLRERTEALAELVARERRREPAPSGPALVYRLELKRLVSWHDRFGNLREGDLACTVYPTATACAAPPARVDGWHDGRHALDVSDLEIADGVVRGRVVVHLYRRPVPAVVAVEVDGAVAGKPGKRIVRGTYTTAGGPAVAPRTGVLAGTVRAVAADLEGPAAPSEDLLSSEAVNHYRRARWLEARSRHLYRELRARTIARHAGLALPLAWRVAEDFAPEYPPIPGEKKKGEKAPEAGDDLLGELDAMTDGGGDADASEQFGFLARLLPAMLARAQRRLAIARQTLADAKRTRRTRLVDACPDPDFGPWFGADTPAPGKGGNQLPAVRDAGPQRWVVLTGWRCAGPFPRQDRCFPVMPPDLVPAFDLAYRIDRRRLKDGGKRFEGEPVAAAGPAEVQVGTGFHCSPLWGRINDHGLHRYDYPNSSFYAATELSCAATGRVWCAVTVNDHGRLWLDGRLVWASPRYPSPRSEEDTYVFPLELTKGAHRLLLRCDNDLDAMFFRVSCCLAGEPRPAEAAAAAITERRRAQRRAEPAQRGVGWRYDGGGCYPGDPPLAWDPFAGTNVLWEKHLGFGFATPVVVGDRVLVMEEPHDLVCLDSASGEERWRIACDIVLTKDEQIRAEAGPVRESARAAARRLAELGPGRNEQVAALRAEGLDEEAAKGKQKELVKRSRAYLDFLKRRCGVNEPGWYPHIGYTYATPVVADGRVWVKSNTGALACVGLDGELQWIVDHGGSANDSCSGISSPILVDDLVVCLVPDPRTRGHDERHVLKGFDAATGELRWATPTPVRGECTGGAVALRLTNGSEAMAVVVTANGAVVRAADGAMLHPYLGLHEHYGTPIAADGVVYIGAQRQKAAFEFIMHDREHVGVKTRWRFEHFGVFQDGNYGLVHDGQLCYGRPALDVSDGVTGELLWTVGRPFWCPRNGRGYPPIAAAGGRLYLADNGTWFAPKNRPYTSRYPGALSVILPGAPGLVLARNQVKCLNGGYAAAGNRLYIRAKHSLMCVGHTGESGRRWEAETVARELFAQIMDRPPAAPEEPLAIAARQPDPERRTPRCRVGGDIGSWACVGPFPSAAAAAVAAAVSEPGWLGGEGRETLDAAGGSFPVRRLHGGNMPDWKRPGLFDLSRFSKGSMKHIGYDSLTHPEIAPHRLSEPAADRSLAFASVVGSHYARAARMDTGHTRARAWLGGKPVGHNALVGLPEGHAALVVVVPLDPVPDDRPLWVRPRLHPSGGAEADLARWRHRVDLARPYFERVVELAPESALGKRAAALLATAE